MRLAQGPSISPEPSGSSGAQSFQDLLQPLLCEGLDPGSFVKTTLLGHLDVTSDRVAVDPNPPGDRLAPFAQEPLPKDFFYLDHRDLAVCHGSPPSQTRFLRVRLEGSYHPVTGG